MEENNLFNLIDLLDAEDLTKLYNSFRVLKSEIYKTGAKDEVNAIMETIKEKIENLD